MKTKLLITAIIISASSMQGNANAQLALNTSYKSDLKNRYNEMVNSNALRNDKRVLNNIKLNAVRDFIKRYSAAINVKWYTADDGGFIAKFNENSVQTTVAYNQAGNWVHTIKRYDEKGMPANVRADVKRVYYDYDIFHVEEIAAAKNENIIFLVHVRDSTTIKVLKICNDETEILHDYKRGDK